MSAVIEDCSLLARTRHLLRTTDKTYLQIYEATELSPNWLSLVASNRIASPNVNSVQKLYEFLAGRQLQVQ
jgi:hypothetical protein